MHWLWLGVLQIEITAFRLTALRVTETGERIVATNKEAVLSPVGTPGNGFYNGRAFPCERRPTYRQQKLTRSVG